MTLLIGCVYAGLVFWIVQIEIWTKFTTLVLAVFLFAALIVFGVVYITGEEIWQSR